MAHQLTGGDDPPPQAGGANGEGVNYARPQELQVHRCRHVKVFFFFIGKNKVFLEFFQKIL